MGVWVASRVILAYHVSSQFVIIFALPEFFFFFPCMESKKLLEAASVSFHWPRLQGIVFILDPAGITAWLAA